MQEAKAFANHVRIAPRKAQAGCRFDSRQASWRSNRDFASHAEVGFPNRREAAEFCNC